MSQKICRRVEPAAQPAATLSQMLPNTAADSLRLYYLRTTSCMLLFCTYDPALKLQKRIFGDDNVCFDQEDADFDDEVRQTHMFMFRYYVDYMFLAGLLQFVP